MGENSKLNWRVRFANPTWWVLAGIPQLILIVQLILTFVNDFVYPTGYQITEEGVQGFMGIVNAVALLFGIGGSIIDPTTSGFKDSSQASQYKKPNKL
ncbi:holin [Bacillus phage SP-10]|uniref:holin n=1 Tax=Bacillus phage SP10 TaxID=941058 RepID=UPI0002198B55|nr:holin [Bacillus phage SP-10]BAK52941.1 holin [Bacillus phage SP-10]